MKFLEGYQEQVYAATRIIFGALFAIHGAQKVLGVLTESQPAIGTQLWVGGLIELVAGVLIAVGFQTRLAAFLSSGTMAVAYFQFHWKFQFTAAFFPVINGGELAVLYCFAFLLMACKGTGIWGIQKD